MANDIRLIRLGLAGIIPCPSPPCHSVCGALILWTIFQQSTPYCKCYCTRILMCFVSTATNWDRKPPSRSSSYLDIVRFECYRATVHYHELLSNFPPSWRCYKLALGRLDIVSMSAPQRMLPRWLTPIHLAIDLVPCIFCSPMTACRHKLSQDNWAVFILSPCQSGEPQHTISFSQTFNDALLPDPSLHLALFERQRPCLQHQSNRCIQATSSCPIARAF